MSGLGKSSRKEFAVVFMDTFSKSRQLPGTASVADKPRCV